MGLSAPFLEESLASEEEAGARSQDLGARQVPHSGEPGQVKGQGSVTALQVSSCLALSASRVPERSFVWGA